MVDRLPAEIEFHKLPGAGLQYVIRRKAMGRIRFVGIYFMVFSAVFIGAPLGLTMSHFRDGSVHLPGLLLAVPFVCFGAASFLAGLYWLMGHSSVEVQGGVLRAMDGIGPVRIRRSRPVGDITGLNVQKGVAKVHSRPARSASGDELAILIVECGRADKLVCMPIYPRALLLRLAEELACVLSPKSQLVSGSSEAVAVAVVESTYQAPGESDSAAMPSETRIRVEKCPEGLTITVPPAGLWRGSKGLLFFSLLWCAITGVVSVAFLSQQGKPHSPPAPSALFFVSFWAIGVGMLLGALNMARRKAMIGVRGGALLVLTKGIFGEKRRQWDRAELAAICSGPSGMTVNDKPVYELQIRPQKGRKFGFLRGQTREEQEWVAALLRHELRMQSE